MGIIIDPLCHGCHLEQKTANPILCDYEEFRLTSLSNWAPIYWTLGTARYCQMAAEFRFRNGCFIIGHFMGLDNKLGSWTLFRANPADSKHMEDND